MVKFKKCSKCGGNGDIPVTRIMPGGGLFGWRIQCERCEGTGEMPYDPWLKPTLWLCGLVALYFIWQFTR